MSTTHWYRVNNLVRAIIEMGYASLNADFSRKNHLISIQTGLHPHILSNAYITHWRVSGGENRLVLCKLITLSVFIGVNSIRSSTLWNPNPHSYEVGTSRRSRDPFSVIIDVIIFNEIILDCLLPSIPSNNAWWTTMGPTVSRSNPFVECGIASQSIYEARKRDLNHGALERLHQSIWDLNLEVCTVDTVNTKPIYPHATN